MEPQVPSFPRFRCAADQAVIVEFAETIDPAANARVIALDGRLAAQPVAGVVETLPTYRSLMVRYDPLQTSAARLIETLQTHLETLEADPAEGRLWHVPAVYGGAAGQDLDAVAAYHGLTSEEVIALHLAGEYRVYMIGFMPGYAYLGGLDSRLHTPRLQTPRQLTAAGGLAIGGQQASINSVASPSGWRFIARTPLRTFDPRRAAPCLLAAGDRIRFVRIGEGEAARLDALAEAGEVVAEPEPRA